LNGLKSKFQKNKLKRINIMKKIIKVAGIIGMITLSTFNAIAPKYMTKIL